MISSPDLSIPETASCRIQIGRRRYHSRDAMRVLNDMFIEAVPSLIEIALTDKFIVHDQIAACKLVLEIAWGRSGCEKVNHYGEIPEELKRRALKLVWRVLKLEIATVPISTSMTS